MENFDINVKDVGEISKFKSMSLRTINNETEIASTVDAVLLGYIANSDHVFQIGDFLYYVTYESTYEIPMKFVTSTKLASFLKFQMLQKYTQLKEVSVTKI